MTSAPHEIRSEPPPGTGSGAGTGVIIVLTIAALYFGREIFVPFALAILLSFMLAPPVERLRRLHVPRVAAVGLVVAFAFVLLGGLAMLVGSQIVQLARNLPEYQQTMQQKIRAIRASAGEDGLVDRTAALFQALREELEPPREVTAESAATPTGVTETPIKVQVDPPPKAPLEVIGRVLAPILGPIGTAGLVIVFVVFMLLERYDMRDRFLRLAGGGLHRTTSALNEAAQRVSRYLMMQLIVNATYGVPIGLGLYLIGVPNAMLWGLLATILRFVPYLGPFIAALFPMALAFAVDPGWSMLLWTIALVLGMELVSNNVVEPWLYGSSTGLSPVAIILAAIFWTLIWGPVGLILATPLTVCLATLGRYVPRLDFLDILLGSTPVFTPQEQFCQRLLAGNMEEAIEMAETHVAESSALDFYDRVGLPALGIADRARKDGSSTDDRRRVAAGLQSVVRELGAPEIEPDAGARVLCIAGRWELDDAAAAMLAHALNERGTGARQFSAQAIAPDAIGKLDLTGVEIVCLSYLDPSPQSYARFVCRRLRRRKPQLKIIVGAWNLPPDAVREHLATEMAADTVETSLAGATDAVARLLEEAPGRAVAADVPEDEAARLEALHASGMTEVRAGGHFDHVAHVMADAFEVPIALVSLIDESCQLWTGAAGLPADLDASRQASRETSICGHVVAGKAPLMVEDTSLDPRFAANPFLQARGIRFYAGAPLRTAAGYVIGSLCVLDTRPRSFTEREMKLLQVLADELMAGVEKGGAAASTPMPSPA